MKHVNEIQRDGRGRALGAGFSMRDLRDKINEIVDYINAKESGQEENEGKIFRK